MIKNKPPAKDTGSDTGDDGIGEVLFETPDATEEPEVADIEEDITEELKKYKEKLKTCQKERNEYLDGWQRSKADYLNSKRRLEAERQHEDERHAARFIEKLLPLCDSFDLALQNLAKHNEAENEPKSDWRTGIEQIHNQLLCILKSYNVEVLVPLGLPFDPHFHEAVLEEPVTDSAQHHIILNVLQNGYTIGERLIRPAKVTVGNYKMHSENKN